MWAASIVVTAGLTILFALALIASVGPRSSTRSSGHMKTARGITPEVEPCGACVAHYIAREGSFYPCALLKGHNGKHRAAGNCFKHGPYLGQGGTVPQCPQWPSCIDQQPEPSEAIKDLLDIPYSEDSTGIRHVHVSLNFLEQRIAEAYRRGRNAE